MGRHRKRKKPSKGNDGPIDLNVMPFIDVFSLLTTFLLFSAVFIQIGILEVQVPFLSNSNPPDMAKPVREISIKLDLRKDYVEIQTAYSQPPLNETADRFDITEAGVNDMHAKLVGLRIANPESDKLTLFADDDVKFETIAKILDATKFLKEGDSKAIQQPDPKKQLTEQRQMFLFPKVIMGSVML